MGLGWVWGWGRGSGEVGGEYPITCSSESSWGDIGRHREICGRYTCSSESSWPTSSVFALEPLRPHLLRARVRVRRRVAQAAPGQG